MHENKLQLFTPILNRMLGRLHAFSLHFPIFVFVAVALDNGVAGVRTRIGALKLARRQLQKLLIMNNVKVQRPRSTPKLRGDVAGEETRLRRFPRAQTDRQLMGSSPTAAPTRELSIIVVIIISLSLLFAAFHTNLISVHILCKSGGNGR